MRNRKNRSNYKQSQDVGGGLTRQQLQTKVLRAYVEGNYDSQHDLAVRFGVSDSTICKCLKRVVVVLDEEFKEEAVADKNRRIKQLEKTMSKANLAWERSKQDAEELRIQYVKTKCRECGGSGLQKDGTSQCESCEGKKRVTEEVISRKVVGQAGDPRFLSVVKECVKEIARLNGHYNEKKAAESEGEGDKHLHLHLGEAGKVDPEILIQMRRLMIQAEESRGENGRMMTGEYEQNDASHE